MAKHTINLNNIQNPSPRWYRITKKIFYGVFATALFSDVLVEWVGMSAEDVNMLSALCILIIETTGSVLANGERYTKDDKISK